MMAPDALQHPSPKDITILLSWYWDSVDTIFKMLHTPSVRAHLQEGKSYLNNAPGDPAVTALCFAIFYAAATTVTEETCLKELGEGKALLRNRFRFGIEVSLAQADFVNSRDIACLQALLLLLVRVKSSLNLSSPS